MPLILGLTGNIASGKSTVAREFARLGAVVVDADQLAREVVAPGSAVLEKLVETFGEEILRADGTLDRSAMGQRIFADQAARERLNRIIHPAIAELSTKRLAELRHRRDLPLILYEAPLLFEAGAENRVDRVLVVTVDPQVQVRRLMARDHCDAAAARQKIAAQMPQAEKIARADYVIDNSTTPADLQRQVERVWAELCCGFKNRKETHWPII